MLKESATNDLEKDLDRKNSISLVNIEISEMENTLQQNSSDNDSSDSREDIDEKISNNYHDGVLHLEDSIERLRQLLEEKKDSEAQGFSRSMSDPAKDVKKIDYDQHVLRTYSETDETDKSEPLQTIKVNQENKKVVSFQFKNSKR